MNIPCTVTAFTNFSSSLSLFHNHCYREIQNRFLEGTEGPIRINLKELIFVFVFLSGGSLAVPVFWWFLLIYHTVPCREQWQKNTILHKHQHHHDNINLQKLFYSWIVGELRRKSSKFWLLGWICFSNIELTPPGTCRLQSYHVLNSQRCHRSCNILIHRLFIVYYQGEECGLIIITMESLSCFMHNEGVIFSEIFCDKKLARFQLGFQFYVVLTLCFRYKVV